MSYDPYALAFPAASFPLHSEDFAMNSPLPAQAYATGASTGESPQLSWGPLPDGTRSVVVTAFDADAPIPGGLWHWAVKDIPGTVPGLARGAASDLPPGAVHLPNDLGVAGYSGAKPPPGTGTHRMFVCVTALTVDRLDVPPGASLAMLNILLIPHTAGRAVLVGTSTPDHRE
ncbi:YbhB/YbcL family Raf kinase inhibitor-like protein [Couchioplanes caeruleus]|uniref:YbhB/YbcL family Raf kinase inhibitor-like protein n=1 Tax=Couchioplanes caeruleus TaxID=56438 RepID=UPI0020BD9683|nr:YbhB/YbcL family Raf kinase inhibitor-like protein [Couchioplanes caeruleus]UQU62027.1 YbhB/YbcL family Raf kinase inhibitor-like protein [Couchioplanes caeruleus]